MLKLAILRALAVTWFAVSVRRLRFYVPGD